jgi:hypothetical protein
MATAVHSPILADRPGAWPGSGGLVLPLLLAGAFLLLGLLTLGAYGVTWDETLHRDWGEKAWAFLLTGDEELVRDLPGGGRYYGPLFYMLSYGVAEAAQKIVGLHFTAANHLLTLITASVGLLCTFLLAETLATRRAAIVATLLLVLLPPLQAHAHYNPKDIPLLTLTVAALLFATRAYHDRQRRNAVITGVFLGIALSMKVTAIVIIPIVGGAIVMDMFVRRSWSAAEIRSIASLAAIAAVSSLVSLVLSWPTVWREPRILIETVRYFGIGTFWAGDVLYFGDLVRAADLPWHYMPVMLLISIPLIMIVLAAAGVVTAIGQLIAGHTAHRRAATRDRDHGVYAAALLLLWVALPLLMFMKPGLPRYDGMRQLFFMVPSLAILGGIGWERLRRAVTTDRARAVIVGASALAAAWLVAESVRYYPHGGSYVNAATRAALGPRLDKRFEVEYWGASYREGARWLQANAAPGSVVCVPVAEHVLGWQAEVMRDDLTYTCDAEPDYVMVITRTSLWPDEYLHLTDARPLFRVERAGSDLLHIYDIRRPR